MDPNTAYFIVASGRRQTDPPTQRVGPFFDSLYHAAHALGFLRRRTPSSVNLHIEQGVDDKIRRDG